MTRDKLKIAFVHNAYIEYRIPLFERISAIYAVNFFVEWFDSSISRNKSKFSFQLLRSCKITNEYSFSPMLFVNLLKGKYNLFIAGAIGQINTYITFFVSRLLRRPFIFWDENWYWPRTGWRRLVWPLVMLILNNAEAIIVPGLQSKRFYTSASPSVRSKIFVAPNTSLLAQNAAIQLQAKALRKSLKLENKKVILYCGRLIKVKGFEYLLKAFSKLQISHPDTVLLIIGGVYGTGSRYGREELERIYRVFGPDKVLFTGTLVNPEKTVYFLLADLTVVPSIFLDTEYEVWGFAVNESMSIGKPVIATEAVGAAYDLIQNGRNGYIVPEKNSEALFKAITEILEDCNLEKKGFQSLLTIQEGFTYDFMLKGFKQAINFACMSNSRRLRKYKCNNS